MLFWANQWTPKINWNIWLNFINMFFNVFGGVLEGVWGCFAWTCVVFWRDLGGKHRLINLKQKHLNQTNLAFDFACLNFVFLVISLLTPFVGGPPGAMAPFFFAAEVLSRQGPCVAMFAVVFLRKFKSPSSTSVPRAYEKNSEHARTYAYIKRNPHFIKFDFFILAFSKKTYLVYFWTK